MVRGPQEIADCARASVRCRGRGAGAGHPLVTHSMELSARSELVRSSGQAGSLNRGGPIRLTSEPGCKEAGEWRAGVSLVARTSCRVATGI